MKKFTKWLPVIVTTIVACAQAIAEKMEGDQIDEMEKRISKLENKES